MDARVKFTEDFKNKTKGKKLSPREIGKLRWQKIVEAKGVYSTYYYSTGSKPKHTGFSLESKSQDEPKPQRPTKAIIRYAGMEIELENYCAADIATIAKSLGE